MLRINDQYKNKQYILEYEEGEDYPNNINNNVEFGFKDFSGSNGRYPYFTLKIKDDRIAQKLYDEGFNIQFSRTPDYILEDPTKDPEEYAYPNQLQINVNLKPVNGSNGRAPKVWLVFFVTDIDGSEKIVDKVQLDKDTLGILDNQYIERVDTVMFTGHHNDRHKRPNGKTAYAQVLYLFVRKDSFEEKYGF